MSEHDSHDLTSPSFPIWAVGNVFAVAGFFLHPLLHWWVRSSPAMEQTMHGYSSLWIEDDHVLVLRFFLVWMGEIAALWLLGAGVALISRTIIRASRRR